MKKALSILLALTLAACMAVPAFAEETPVSKNAAGTQELTLTIAEPSFTLTVPAAKTLIYEEDYISLEHYTVTVSDDWDFDNKRISVFCGSVEEYRDPDQKTNSRIGILKGTDPANTIKYRLYGNYQGHPQVYRTHSFTETNLTNQDKFWIGINDESFKAAKPDTYTTMVVYTACPEDKNA